MKITVQPKVPTGTSFENLAIGDYYCHSFGPDGQPYGIYRKLNDASTVDFSSGTVTFTSRSYKDCYRLILNGATFSREA